MHTSATVSLFLLLSVSSAFAQFGPAQGYVVSGLVIVPNTPNHNPMEVRLVTETETPIGRTLVRSDVRCGVRHDARAYALGGTWRWWPPLRHSARAPPRMRAETTGRRFLRGTRRRPRSFRPTRGPFPDSTSQPSSGSSPS